MSQWDKRYSNFPTHMQDYLNKAEKLVTDLLKQRPWIRAGLERHIWRETGIYPSLVGQTIKTLTAFGRCWIGKLENRDLRIVKQHRNDPVPKDFDAQHKRARLNMHLTSTKFHSDVLEILINLSLYLINERLAKPFELRPNEIVGGQQFDTILCYLSTNIGIETRNKTGDASIREAREYVQKCNERRIRPMMVATWLTSEAQAILRSANGFYSNLCRIYTAQDYPENQNDFNQNGFEQLTTVLDLNRWGWLDATEAKKWLNTQMNRNRLDEIIQKAKQIFQADYEKRALLHLMQEITGITAYSLATIRVEAIIQAERDLRTFGSKPMTERQKRQLFLAPIVYLNMLFRAASARPLSEITDSFSHIPFIKKQNKQNRIHFMECILKFLEDLHLIEKRGSTWTIIDAKSPYIEKTGIF